MTDDLILDPINKGHSHTYFNASILSCFSGRPIFIGNKSHIEKVKDLVSCKHLAIQDSAFSIRILKAFLILLKNCMFTTRKIYFLCLDNTLIPTLLLLAYPLLYKNDISVIIHNNLTTLEESKFKRFLHNTVTKLYKVKVYVLTKKMENIYRSVVRDTDLCTYIPHPNYSNILKDVKCDVKVLSSSKINIVLLGRQAPILMDYMKSLDYSKYPDIHFTFVHPNANEHKTLPHEPTILREKLSFNHYFSVLAQADFCLFASDKSVKNRASGILMDCITLGCPIIAPSIGHFAEYEQFNLGYLYDNYNDLTDTLKKIDNQNIRRDQFVNDFLDALNYSSLARIKSLIQKRN